MSWGTSNKSEETAESKYGKVQYGVYKKIRIPWKRLNKIIANNTVRKLMRNYHCKCVKTIYAKFEYKKLQQDFEDDFFQFFQNGT